MTTGTSLGPESYDRDIRYRRGFHTANRSITYIILLLQSHPHTKPEYDTEWDRGGGLVGKG